MNDKEMVLCICYGYFLCHNNEYPDWPIVYIETYKPVLYHSSVLSLSGLCWLRAKFPQSTVYIVVVLSMVCDGLQPI